MNSNDHSTRDWGEFARQCAEMADRISKIIFEYPKPVALVVLPGVIASIAITLNISHETIVEMVIDAADKMASIRDDED